MKKLGAFLMGLSLVAGSVLAANTNTATSVNMVGFQNISAPNGWIMLSLNWNSVGGGSQIPINTLFGGSGLHQALDFGSADKLYVWDPALNSGVGGYKMYYLYTDGLWYEYLNDTDPTTNCVTRGGGLWLKHEAATTNVVLSGEVPVVSTNITSIGAGLWGMIGPSFTADMSINGPNVVWSGNPALDFGSADKLYVWNTALNSGAGGYKMYYLYTDGAWYEYLNDSFPTTDVIPMGGGAWFKNVGPAVAVLTEIKPY